MNFKEVLDIIGSLASIITVIGGLYGLYTWIKTRKAKVVAHYYTRSEQHIFILYVYNEGPCEARNVRLSGGNIESHAVIPALQPGQEGQLSFECHLRTTALPIKIHWRDDMGGHCKRIKLTASMRRRQ